MTAADKILQKALVGSGIDSRGWSLIQAGLRDRAFFSATVTELRTLDSFRSNVAAMLEPGKSASEARRDIRAGLAAMGYDPGDKAGTIKDLMTRKRLDVMLKTNSDMARGYVSHLRATTEGALAAFPAYELVRVERRNLPRDWHNRWRQAASSVGWQGVAKRTDKMVALKTSPVWRKLSRFGNDYPPFDYNSGMGVRDVGRDECESLGLVKRGETLRAPETPDLNANLTETVQFKNDESWQRLKKAFGDQIQVDRKTGLVKWRSELFEENFEKGGNFTIRLGEATGAMMKKLPTAIRRESVEGKPLTVTQDFLDKKRADGSDHRAHFRDNPEHPEDIPLRKGDVALLPSLWRNPDRIFESFGRLVLEIDGLDGSIFRAVVDVEKNPTLRTFYRTTKPYKT